MFFDTYPIDSPTNYYRRAAHGGPSGKRGLGGRGHVWGSGPIGPGGGGRDRREMFGPRDLRLALLALTGEKPRHGYELIKDLKQNFGGGYASSPGSVYPTLTVSEKLGYVRSASSEGSKRLYEITAEGSSYLHENEAALHNAKARMAMAARAVSGDAPPPELFQAMNTLEAALAFHRGGWDEKETERVRRTIENAADAFSRGTNDE